MSVGCMSRIWAVPALRAHTQIPVALGAVTGARCRDVLTRLLSLLRSLEGVVEVSPQIGSPPPAPRPRPALSVETVERCLVEIFD